MTLCIFFTKQKSTIMRSSFFLLLTSFFGCANKPVLQSNDKLQKAGKKVAKKDIAYCEDIADKQLNSFEKQRDKEVKKSSRSRNVWAVGAISGILKGDNSNAVTPKKAETAAKMDNAKEKITTKCLAQKGYRVIGFD